MSIDPLKFDNPLSMESVPRDHFPIQFPARHDFDVGALRQSVMVITGVILTVVFFAYISAYAFSSHASVVSGISRVLLLILTVAVFGRWESRSLFSFYATAAVTAICLFATSTAVFMSGADGALTAICSLTMLTLLWTAAEIAIHFQSIDSVIIRRDPSIADQRRQQNTGVLQFFAVVMGIALCFALWTSLRLVAVPIAAMLGMLAAFSLVAEFAKFPGKFLPLTIMHYLGYPASSLLAPGLIRSSAPHPFLRLLPFVLVVVESALIAVADHGIANALVEPALMAGYGVLVGLTALMLGASLSARPIHFDLDRTPFDVVVSKLQGEENENV
jgi:hypothetical protein